MKGLDVPLLVVAVALCLLGALVLDSATAQYPVLSPEVVRQGAAMAIGLALMLGLSCLDLTLLRPLAGPLYLVGLVTLVLVRIPGIGQISHGARRWMVLGPVVLQPSEPVKLLVVIAVAALLAAVPSARPGRALAALGLAALPAALIVLQPDMGTALVLIGTVGVMVFVAGASPLLLAGLAATAWAIAPHVLYDYQKRRLLAYLNPDVDPMGVGYNLIQARVALGAGRQWGTGLFSGPMSQHGFVPENWTDFIFSVVGEELGFVGCVGFLALYAILIGCLVRTALTARDRFDMLLTTGIAAMIAMHVFVNVGMVLGLLPATGLPLPFVSYGGSAIVTLMAALGLAMATYRSRRSALQETASSC